ncbi:MAG: GNAT family N-acetyltransferase [Spirochaetes bacterium]|uniref:GNAT family N-acetyltransferase n=1 Tax=Candidatus Avitreponema avistercoris TaxID=2840705 RepID=A0A9D9HDM3_9SPIR|nr:GNAT family N-acetyltransferase [Candidatus Avitreponema avistercoris]
MVASVRAYMPEDVHEAAEIWNRIVREGTAFPQTDILPDEEAHRFFSGQTFTGIAEKNGSILGLYILHPNNVGRCGHIANASYAVRDDRRGHGIGEILVRHSLQKAKELGFRILQFNAVVRTNKSALYLYEKLGFTQLGIIPGGFRMDGGRYEDIIPHYKVL